MFYSAKTGGFYSHEIHGSNIPADAVELSDGMHQQLMEGQATGKIIMAGKNGYPVLMDAPQPDADQLAAAARADRDARIAATDYMLMRDYPVDDKLLADVKAYRQALRDVPSQSGFPRNIEWPELQPED